MKTQDHITWAGFVSLVLCASSCSPGLYSTVGQNVPLFTQKGEVALSGGKSDAINDYDILSGFHAQIAAAVDSNLAVISSLYSLRAREGMRSGDWSGGGSYLEVGVGKFSSNKASKVRVEAFIGAGLGSLKNKFENKYLNARYIKPFIQPTVGFSSKYFDAAFTPRLAWVSFFSRSDRLDPEENMLVEDFFMQKGRTLVLEPGFTLRGGVGL